MTIPTATARPSARSVDIYFSADVETDGPIPGPYSMLSFALVEAGRFDGTTFERAPVDAPSFYAELRPISEQFQPEALAVNGLDREQLRLSGEAPEQVMTRAAEWVRERSNGGSPVLVAYPVSFDWTWLYWYFVQYASQGSPFNHSRCFDLKTAFATKAGLPITGSGRDKLPPALRSQRPHSHHALDDAREQADIFANLFEWTKP